MRREKIGERGRERDAGETYLVTFIYPQSYLAGVRIATMGYDQQRAGVCEPWGLPWWLRG